MIDFFTDTAGISGPASGSGGESSLCQGGVNCRDEASYIAGLDRIIAHIRRNDLGGVANQRRIAIHIKPHKHRRTDAFYTYPEQISLGINGDPQ